MSISIHFLVVVCGHQLKMSKALQRVQRFRMHLLNSKAVAASIPVDKIVDEILMQPVVRLWENITLGLDFDVPSECSKLALENLVKLENRVKGFSHAKDIVSRSKQRQKHEENNQRKSNIIIDSICATILFK